MKLRDKSIIEFENIQNSLKIDKCLENIPLIQTFTILYILPLHSCRTHNYANYVDEIWVHYKNN